MVQPRLTPDISFGNLAQILTVFVAISSATAFFMGKLSDVQSGQAENSAIVSALAERIIAVERDIEGDREVRHSTSVRIETMLAHIIERLARVEERMLQQRQQTNTYQQELREKNEQ